MNPPTSLQPHSSQLPRIAVRIMIVILIAMALLSLYSNVQRWRRDKVETVIVMPAASPSSTAPSSKTRRGHSRGLFVRISQRNRGLSLNMKKLIVLPLVVAVSIFSSCQKQQTEAERQAEVQRKGRRWVGPKNQTQDKE